MKLVGHPSHHGHHVNPHGCGSGDFGRHRFCSGFSGDYDTYRCGCCCHDLASELTDDERVVVDRLRGGRQ